MEEILHQLRRMWLSQGNRSHQVETTWHASSTAVCWCSGGLCFAATSEGVHRLGLEMNWTLIWKLVSDVPKAEAADQRCLQGCWFCVSKGWTCTWFYQQHIHIYSPQTIGTHHCPIHNHGIPMRPLKQTYHISRSNRRLETINLQPVGSNMVQVPTKSL